MKSLDRNERNHSYSSYFAAFVRAGEDTHFNPYRQTAAGKERNSQRVRRQENRMETSHFSGGSQCLCSQDKDHWATLLQRRV